MVKGQRLKVEGIRNRTALEPLLGRFSTPVLPYLPVASNISVNAAPSLSRFSTPHTDFMLQLRVVVTEVHQGMPRGVHSDFDTPLITQQQPRSVIFHTFDAFNDKY